MSGSAAAVTQFHGRVQLENPAIYARSYRRVPREHAGEGLLDLLAADRRNLGTEKKTSSTGFFVNATTGGTVIRLNYNTTFTGPGRRAVRLSFPTGQVSAIRLQHQLPAPDHPLIAEGALPVNPRGPLPAPPRSERPGLPPPAEPQDLSISPASRRLCPSRPRGLYPRHRALNHPDHRLRQQRPFE